MHQIRKNFLRFLLFIGAWIFFPVVHAQVPQEQLAIQFFQNAEYEKAAELFSHIFNQRQDAYIYSYYYATLLELKDYNTAEKVVKRMVKRQQDQPRYEVDLGFIYQQAEQPLKAQKIFDKIIENLNNDNYTIETTAEAFQTKGNNDYALKVLFQGRKLQNEKAVSEMLHLLSNTDTRYLNECETLLQNFLADDAEEAKYHLVKAELLKLYQKHPDVFSYSYLLFGLSLQHHEFDLALQQAKSIDKRYKEGGQRLYDFAEIAAENREYEVAINALNFIIEQGPKSDYYIRAKYFLLDVKFDKVTLTYPIKPEDLNSLENDYKNALKEYGIHEGTSEWIKKY